MKKDKLKKPSGFLYAVLVFIIKILSKTFTKFKIKRDPQINKLEGPILCLCTHTAILDIVALMLSMYKTRKLNIVVGRDVLSWKILAPILKRLAVIPMSQFGLDISAIRDMTNAVKDGRSIALFPEGKISLDGQNFHYISPSIAKLVKMIGAHVVFAHNYGAYSNNPKWASDFRKGPILHDIKVLFTKEELELLSVDEINERIQNSFAFNENKRQVDNNLRYKTKKPALGLEYILYKCPKCGAEYEHITTNRFIECLKCQNKVELTEYGNLISTEGSLAFERIDLWYDWQRQSIRNEIQNPSFIITENVTWTKLLENSTEYQDSGAGTLSITYEKIIFNGKDIDNKEVSIEYPLSNQTALIQKRKQGVDLTANNSIDRFMFVDAKYASKWNQIVEEIFRDKNNLPKRGESIQPA